MKTDLAGGLVARGLLPVAGDQNQATRCKPCNLSSKPQTLNPPLQSLNPKHQALNHQLWTLNCSISTLHYKTPEPLNPKLYFRRRTGRRGPPTLTGTLREDLWREDFFLSFERDSLLSMLPPRDTGHEPMLRERDQTNYDSCCECGSGSVTCFRCCRPGIQVMSPCC